MGGKLESVGSATVYSPPFVGNSWIQQEAWQAETAGKGAAALPKDVHKSEKSSAQLLPFDAAKKPEKSPPVVHWFGSSNPVTSSHSIGNSLDLAIKKWNLDPEMMDPGFSGGVKAIQERRREESVFLHAILKGESYSQARHTAGMSPEFDCDPGMNADSGPGLEQRRTAAALRDARLLQEIANGTPYQAARKRAGLDRDMDPGMSGGEARIEENLKRRAERLGIMPEVKGRNS